METLLSYLKELSPFEGVGDLFPEEPSCMACVRTWPPRPWWWLGGFRRMTGEQRSGDGWKERENEGFGEVGNWDVLGLVGRKTFSGRFWGGSIWREGDSGIISNVWFSHVHVFFLLWYLGIKETLFYRLNMSSGMILVFLLWNLISPVLACCWVSNLLHVPHFEISYEILAFSPLLLF